MEVLLQPRLPADNQADSHELVPLVQARTMDEYHIQFKDVVLAVKSHEHNIRRAAGKKFRVPGTCVPCDRRVGFKVDYVAGGSPESGPNWRERLICPHCHMSNRQRLMAGLVLKAVRHSGSPHQIYLMEQMTPLYKWLLREMGGQLTGSEYLGEKFTSGDRIGLLDYQTPFDPASPLRSLKYSLSLSYMMLRTGKLRHEDVNRLSFDDETYDIIVSNDVFEHLPEPGGAFRECVRVLRRGGMMLATFPFSSREATSVIRARMCDGHVEHLLPETYHGNPVSTRGTLVFTDFGWDVFGMFEEAGFSDAVLEVYRSVDYGHLGAGLIVFRLTR